MIRLHNYNNLVEQREELLLQKQSFYKKYFTQDDSVIWGICTREDYPIWDEIDKKLFELNELIEGWEKGYRKG